MELVIVGKDDGPWNEISFGPELMARLRTTSVRNNWSNNQSRKRMKLCLVDNECPAPSICRPMFAAESSPYQETVRLLAESHQERPSYYSKNCILGRN